MNRHVVPSVERVAEEVWGAAVSSSPVRMISRSSRLARIAVAVTMVAGAAGAVYLVADSRPSVAPASPARVYSDGLADSYDGYTLIPITLPSRRGATVLEFRIVGTDGADNAYFQWVHTKQLHLYVLRDDMSGYQHLHPDYSDGRWRAPIAIGDGGAYRMYTEFTPVGRAATDDPTVLGVPFVVPGDTTMVPVPAPVAQVRSGPFTVTRLDGPANLVSGQQTVLSFRITNADGTPAPLEPYLGAFAHLSNFEVRTQKLMHLHPLPTSLNGDLPPADGVLQFHAVFAERGDQRMFLQFQAAGKVHQVAFTVFAT
ncbi:hypothetical protein [Pilimelia columellifera]|uniref:hypothetical protein n=1 Tax=Pilimelia columellifera TaxID=706574 RepID=UPI0031E2C3B9